MMEIPKLDDMEKLKVIQFLNEYNTPSLAKESSLECWSSIVTLTSLAPLSEINYPMRN